MHDVDRFLLLLSLAGESLSWKYVILIVLFVLSVLGVFFFGLSGLGAALLAIAVYVLVLVKGSSREEMEHRRALLEAELRTARKRYMKHQMDESTYHGIVEEKQGELIGLEAKLELRAPDTDDLPVERLDARRRHKLKDLLSQKAMALRELSISKQKYMKREIPERTYRALLKEKQTLLVEIDTRVSELFREESREIMGAAKRQLHALNEKR